jgi:hypothetical protein
MFHTITPSLSQIDLRPVSHCVGSTLPLPLSAVLVVVVVVVLAVVVVVVAVVVVVIGDNCGQQDTIMQSDVLSVPRFLSAAVAGPFL